MMSFLLSPTHIGSLRLITVIATILMAFLLVMTTAAAPGAGGQADDNHPSDAEVAATLSLLSQ